MVWYLLACELINIVVTMPETRIKVLFICLGNICRSPLGEGVFLHLVKKAGLEQAFLIDSAGTSGYHDGEDYHIESRRVARDRGVALQGVSRKLIAADLDEFDYLIAMDSSNYQNILSLDTDGKSAPKVFRLLDLADDIDIVDVPDPYYGGPDGFDLVFDYIESGCRGLLEKIRAERNL